MKTYIDTGREFRINGTTIPKAPGNVDYDRAMAEIASGAANTIPAPQVVDSIEGKLAGSDWRLARVMEDMVAVLLNKQVISLSDLSVSAVEMINERRKIRGDGPLS